MRTWAGRILVAALVVLVFVPSSALAQTGPTGTGPTGPTASDPCAWERGGIVESTPIACPPDSPVFDDRLGELTEATVLGLGLIVFLLAVSVVYSWRRRGGA